MHGPVKINYLFFHWIDDWKLKYTTLDFCILSGAHTGENLAEKFIEVLQEFNITTKVNYVITFYIY